ncbi:MAG: T9SS type A sorting domain-containing protein [Candidatus Eisenbacteria sp.]|nr:T9SS type A sorting domain-containing protein [Candidatus Eisenbacteria bacterium]
MVRPGGLWQKDSQDGGGASGRALQVFHGRLLVGGAFQTAGGVSSRNVAQWDGEHWLPIPGNTHGLDDRVQVLIEHRGELIAGGWFRQAGGTELNFIGQWDGSRWESLGLGVDSGVFALASYRGDLIAGGWFAMAGGAPAAGIARWDGQAWHPMGTGVEGGVVLALYEYGEHLIVGGTFDRAGGRLSPRIARWNGTQWLPFADGIAGSFGGAVYDLETYHGQLVAAGDFGIASGQHIRSIALWDGVEWQPLGDGLTHDEYDTWFPMVVVRSTVVFDNRLVAAGYFTHADGCPAMNIACWNGAEWRPMGDGLAKTVESLCVYEGRLVAAGRMRTDLGSPWDHVAQWDGLQWSCLGSGICTNSYPSILAMAEFDGDLYFGGLFHDAGDRPADHIARWTDTSRGTADGPRHLRVMPNPVREGSVIQYFLPGARIVDLTLHDITGRIVSRLASTEQGGGWHALSWSGLDDEGRRLASGVYLLRVDSGSKTTTGRILLVD